MEAVNVDNPKAVITHLDWCAGYGGIGLGLKRIYGERLRTIAYSDAEGYAIANLLGKIEDGRLDLAPIWTDIKTFPGEEFCGMVDILSAGYPCQPFSYSGERKGDQDPRHLWPHICRQVRVIRPRCLYFENVEGHLSLSDLNKCLLTWKKWVTAIRRDCLRRAKLEVPICGNEYLYLPTPNASDWKHSVSSTAVLNRMRKKQQIHFPYPYILKFGKVPGAAIFEIAMGIQIGWTELSYAGTELYRKWQKERIESSSAKLNKRLANIL